MSGHSKWATIKHQKGAADAKRGKLFSRLSKLISIAVREGGSDDSGFNPKLRMAVEKAKEANMPKDKIQRAIDKGAGRLGGQAYESLVFEGFGPHKVALMMEVVTDNRNRTTSELKSLVDKHGGVFGAQGSTSYFFDRKGVIQMILPEGKNADDFQLEVIDFGVEDMQLLDTNRWQIFVEVNQTHEIADRLQKAGYTITEVDVERIANTFVDLNARQMEQLKHFIDLIDDYEDIQKVYHNAKNQA